MAKSINFRALTKKITPKKIAVLVFAIYLVAGLLVFADYGMSWDEQIERSLGFVNYVHVMGDLMRDSDSEIVRGIANNTPELTTYSNRAYGAASQTIPVLVEHLFKFGISQRNAYLMRHLFVFLNYYLAGIFFYLMLFRRFGNTYIPLLGALFYILYPRFFGESFYNIKDILYFSWTVIAAYFVLRWLESDKLKYLLPAAATLAIAINVRILAVSILLLALAFSVIDGIKRRLPLWTTAWKSAKIVIFTFAFYVAVTPYLWSNPFGNIVSIFSSFIDFAWNNLHFYLGEMITRHVPWHYIPVWMSVSVPLLYIALFFAGTAFIVAGLIAFVRQFIRNRQNANGQIVETGTQEKSVPMASLHMYDLFFAAMFFCTLLGFIVFKISMYNGWRHAYGIFLPFLYVAVYGMERVYSFLCGKQAIVRRAFLLFVAVCLGAQLGWIAINHPYQYVYFNVLGRQIAEKNFDIDYWLVSHYDIIKQALADAGDSQITIYNPHGVVSPMLTDEEKSRVFLTEIDYADYYVMDSKGPNIGKKAPEGFEEVMEITVDDFRISSLYKRIPQAVWDADAWDNVLRVTSNANNEDIAALSDGDLATRWATNRPQALGDYVLLEFGRAVEYDSVRLLLTDSFDDYPRDLSISVSEDGANWTQMPTSGQYQFETRPRPYRFMKLQLDGWDDTYWWIISEMQLGYAR